MVKIIFLDIDGPVIPGSQLLVNKNSSWDRIAQPHIIAILNLLCERSGAKIVFNTSHNIPLPNVPDIEVALVNQGLSKEYLYWDDLKTKFPSKGYKRHEGVTEWLYRNKPEVWVGFDDVKYTLKDNLIVVDYDVGITLRDAEKALEILTGRKEWLTIN